MIGAVARIKIKHGKDRQFLELAHARINANFAGTGRVADCVLKLDHHPGEYVLVAIYPDRETYLSNTAHLDTDWLNRRIRALLAADPAWSDGEIIASWGLGGI